MHIYISWLFFFFFIMFNTYSSIANNPVSYYRIKSHTPVHRTLGSDTLPITVKLWKCSLNPWSVCHSHHAASLTLPCLSRYGQWFYELKFGGKSMATDSSQLCYITRKSCSCTEALVCLLTHYVGAGSHQLIHRKGGTTGWYNIG